MATLRPALRAATMDTLIGLLAFTGPRDGEAFALDRHDIDRANGLLMIRDSKFGKSREVLIHDSAMAALDAYLAHRDELRPGGDHPPRPMRAASAASERRLQLRAARTDSAVSLDAQLRLFAPALPGR